MSSPSENGNAAPALAAEAKKLSLTDREQEILSKAWNCMKTQPEVRSIPTASTLSGIFRKWNRRKHGIDASTHH
jgi:hypothetical protein